MYVQTKGEVNILFFCLTEGCPFYGGRPLDLIVLVILYVDCGFNYCELGCQCQAQAHCAWLTTTVLSANFSFH